jgi:hypothetical protein
MKDNCQIYDVKNFIYLAAMMKSSSSLLWSVLSAIQESDNRADPSKIEDAMQNDFMPMSLEFLESFRRGGVFKNHAPLEYHNDRFLKQTGCKYVILMRHPADHLAAFYCHCRGLRAEYPFPAERKTPWGFSVGQVPLGAFDNESETAIGQLIDCGYLFKCLMWMADWIAFRHPRQSRLLRYEDVIGDFAAVVKELCWFIRSTEPDDDLMRYLLHVFDHVTLEGEKKSALENYPRGWTGRIGTWQDYFSGDNVEAYNRALDRFMNAYPQAEALATVYPDLRIG